MPFASTIGPRDQRSETGAPHYSWLNDLIAVGSGIRHADAVVLDFYRVT